MRSLALVFALCLPFAAFAEEPAPLQVKVGERLKLPGTGVRRVSVGDPEIADIEVSGGMVVVIGVAEGKTFVRITRQTTEERAVEVVAPQPARRR